jgi:hypothetical protein
LKCPFCRLPQAINLVHKDSGVTNALAVRSTSSSDGFELVDKAGNIRKPTDYRAWNVHRARSEGGNQMHVTYASPGTAEYYRKTGTAAKGRRGNGCIHAQLISQAGECRDAVPARIRILPCPLLEDCATKVTPLLKHSGECSEFGRAGREHVRRNFLLPRLIRDDARHQVLVSADVAK